MRYSNICFSGHIGRHLGKLHFQAIATIRDRLVDLDITENGFLFFFVLDLWAAAYKYLFWRPFWPPSWKVAFEGYFQYGGSIRWHQYYRNRLLFVCVADLWPKTYKYLCWRHFGRHLGKLYLQAISTMRGRFHDLDIMEIDSSFVFLADLWPDILHNLLG